MSGFTTPITVSVRIRPLLPEEEVMQSECIFAEPSQNKVAIINTQNHKMKSFEFDHIFPTSSDQQTVYLANGMPLIEDFFNGFNCCLLSYGQNKSGKTHTLIGKES